MGVAGGDEVFIPRYGDEEGVVSGVQAIGTWCRFGGWGRGANRATVGAPGGSHRRGVGIETPGNPWIALLISMISMPGTSVILLHV